MMGTVVLKRALVLETPTQTPDGAGGLLQNWRALGTLWAEIVAGPGREQMRKGTNLSSSRVRITVRAAPVGSDMRPRPDQRFREGSRLFRITAVTERDINARYLTCHAIEEVVV